jgi:hypothetical protein
MIKELSMKVKIDFIEKPVKIPLYIEMKHGEVLNTSYDKVFLKEMLIQNKRNFFFQKGETEATKKELIELEKKIKIKVEETYELEVKTFKKEVEKAMGRLGPKGKAYLFKLEDRNNAD